MSLPWQIVLTCAVLFVVCLWVAGPGEFVKRIALVVGFAALVVGVVTATFSWYVMPAIDREVAQVTKPVTDLKNSADNLKPHLAVPSALTDLAKKAGVP